jgi:hypothetical protein
MKSWLVDFWPLWLTLALYAAYFSTVAVLYAHNPALHCAMSESQP